jgi:hypothetical protein
MTSLVKIVAGVVFDGESDHLDPDAAEVALRRAGFTVARPSALDQFRIALHIGVAGDDFIEAHIDVPSDTSIDAVMAKIDMIVEKYGGEVWECGAEPLDYRSTFDNLFASG